MKYLLLLAVTVVAISEPWTHADLAYPQLERRHMKVKTNRRGQRKMRVEVEQPRSQFPGERRPHPPQSPPRDGDTYVSGTVKGPGRIGVSREKYQNTEHAENSHESEEGEAHRKDVHDAKWSSAEVRTFGGPSAGAGRRSALFHEARVQGSGQSGRAWVRAPPKGGYGTLKKEVNGVVVKDERIRPGETGQDTHLGSRPGEVKYTASASRGGEASVTVNNTESQ